MARWRHAPAEPPARLRCFDQAQWPDPPTWADEEELIAECTRGWHALADPVAWWASPELEGFRAESRWDAARQAWADDHDVDLIEWLINNQLVPARRGPLHG